jgi:inorganic triphosphatase YgiF
VAQEIELKLSLSPQDAQRLWRCQALTSLKRTPLQSLTLNSSYFDTPDARLWRKHLTLRLRRENGQWIQTLKGGGSVLAGLHQRNEWEFPVAGRCLDLEVCKDVPGATQLTRNKIRSALAPQVVTQFRRSRCDLQLGTECMVELGLDRGYVAAGERRQSICEIELELKSGQPDRLFALALDLLREIPFRLEMNSKAERGFALLLDSDPVPVRAPPLHLEATMTPRAGMRTAIWSCLSHFSANETGLLADQDPEYLHQARVALRRLWAALSVFESEFPARERYPDLLEDLRWLTRTLGPARDWDVFMAETLRKAVPQLVHKTALPAIRGRVSRRRKAAHQDALGAVASTRYTSLMMRFAQALLDQSADHSSSDLLFSERTLGSLATGLMEKRYQKVLERGAKSSHDNMEGLHRLRIDVKKLRYVAEFFRDLYPKKQMRIFISALARLQEDLGSLNDAATAGRMLTLLRKEGDAVEMRDALSEIGDWWSAAATDKLVNLPEAWREFSAIRRFWFVS